ncbi:glycerol kinase GlpK [Nocardioides sp. P86]|uniref:glycerol kinase GlpK n=1 Tax=Nocardioides sp. P86 TaxID=2939569 RepID=UPI00203C0ADF|nr:glycerol kinase GlpK [Nocardioides sp. P86]MCM3514188.1 glycerol kinase GlpK [Nocardioides sp. P86]
MSASYVASIDQGTTSTRCLLFDHAGRMVSVAQHEHHQHYPRPGWAEHDAAEIWANTLRVLPEALALAGLQPSDVAAVGIANQRETTVVWDRATGRPVAPAITWQDTRTADLVAELGRSAAAPLFEEVCGLTPAGYFAAPRLRWLLDHVPGLQRRARLGEVAFGTMESWLIWNLTGGPDGGVHVTDVTNASRTMLMDIHTLQWDQRLLDALDVPAAMLPEIRPNAQVYGTCTVGLPGVLIGGAFGDQQAALFGQTCFDEGEAKCTYGTGAFLLMNTGASVRPSTHGLLSTVAYALEGERPVYATEGSIAVAGALVQWFRDSLEMISSAPEIETLARRVEDNGGCYIVPAFAGLFAPRWQADARGVVVGLTSYVTRGHLARAVLEATAWQTCEVVEAVDLDTSLTLSRLRVDGGMTANHLLMQTVADVLDVPVERPLVAESVSLGAAYAAGLAVGFWPDLDVLRGTWRRAALWEPSMSPVVRRRERAAWDRAVQRTLHWVVDEDPDAAPPG